MHKTILFEGTDGTGKTTTLSNLKKELENQGKKCQLITKNNYNLTNQITKVYFKKPIDDNVEICLRIAREFSKINLIDKNVDYTLMDRAVISIASSIKMFDLDYLIYEPLIFELIKRYNKSYTVFCCPKYEVARKRTLDSLILNNEKPSKNESKSDDYNKKLYNIMLELATDKRYTQDKIILIDTDILNKKQCVDKIIRYVN